MERIFNDENEPFWRAAKRMELGPIAPDRFARFIRGRFEATGKAIAAGAVDLVLNTTGGHPYATQELCYFLWQRTSLGATASDDDVAGAVADVLRSEDAHFSLRWDSLSTQQRTLLQALATGRSRPLTAEFRRRHGLPASSSVQRALAALDEKELVGRSGGEAWIREPFLREWLIERA